MNVAEILANAVKVVCPKPSRRIPEGPFRETTSTGRLQQAASHSLDCLPAPGREAAVRRSDIWHAQGRRDGNGALQ